MTTHTQSTESAMFARYCFLTRLRLPRRLSRHLLLIFVLMLGCYLISITNQSQKQQSSRQTKTILIWNSAERIETSTFGLGNETIFARHGCEFIECAVFDKSSAAELPLDEYDAILVHIHELWTTHMPNFQRQKRQRFVFLTQESPPIMNLKNISTLGNIFNWTMSYKLDSDVRLLYGRIRPGPTAPKTPEETRQLIKRTHLPSTQNYATNKTKPLVWMASRCVTPSLRETYVRQLSQFIPVDIYGNCGDLSCPRNSTHWLSNPKCYDTMANQYKFYLSFENSICDDYVTEKFFEIMNHEMIPIVYGGADYSRIAPRHSYIDALEFTPDKLAEYLKQLDANDTLYNEYFWWKDHYQVEAGVEQMARNAFCDLCKKLHQDEGVVKFYPELATDWQPETQTQCKHFSSRENSET